MVLKLTFFSLVTCWFQGWDASAAGKDNLSLLMDGLSANDGQVVASVEDMLSEMNEAKSGPSSLQPSARHACGGFALERTL